MAVSVKITHMDRSKSGKTRVYFDGRNDWRDAFYVGNKCDVPPVGAEIEPDTSSSVFNGNTTWFLNRYKVIKLPQDLASAPQNAFQTSQIPSTRQANTASEPRQQALSTLFDHELRFISNVVGQAVYAMTIKEPGQIKAWFDACIEALRGNAGISRSEQTKAANRYAERINAAVLKGNDSEMMSIWGEARADSDEFQIAVFALLSTPVKNRIRDLEQPQKMERGEIDNSEPAW